MKDIFEQKGNKYLFLIYLVIVLIGVILTLFPLLKNKADLYGTSLNLGTELIGASLIFFILMYFLKVKTTNKLDPNTINMLGDELKDFNQSYSPNKVYFPTLKVGSNFNNDLNGDLAKSSYYFFKGASAKYVPPRILHCRHTLSYTKVIMLHPNNSNSLQWRVSDRSKNPKYSNDSIKSIEDKLRKEIYMSIIGLFDCRNVCTIEISYINDPSVYRVEMLDKALYLSLFHTEEAIGREFPETVRYSNESMLFRLFRFESVRKHESAEKKIKFDMNSREVDLLNHLSEVGMNNLDEIEKYRKEYNKFSNAFLKNRLGNRL